MERPSSPDPVGDPDGYRRHLLGLLGDDDPAVAQTSTSAELRALVEQAGSALRTRPEPREWSVAECIGHIVDAEIVMSARYRWILAHDDPPLIGYDQDLWVDRLHRDDDLDLVLAAFDAMRRTNVDLWRRSSGDDRARAGIHAERGPESYDTMFRMIAGHDRFHLAQAGRALDAVRDG